MKIQKQLIINSSALVYAIFVMLIIISTISVLIYSIYLNRQLLRHVFKIERIISNLESAVAIGLGSENIVHKNDSITFSLFGQGNDSVAIKHEYWGSLNLFTIYSFAGKIMRKKCFFSGSFYKDQNFYVLYLADKKFPLSVSGKTLITGNCFLPNGVVHKSFVNGHYFEGTEPIRGKISYSNDTLPTLNSEILNSCRPQGLKKYFLKQYIPDKRLPIQNRNAPEDFSFYAAPHIYYQKSAISLSGLNIGGKYIILSDDRIEIDSTCIFNDIIVCAPIIVIGSGFTGSIQCIATDSITIEERCRLNYPSLLMIQPDQPNQVNTTPIGLCIKGRSVIQGWVITLTHEKNYRRPILTLNETSSIIGGIYSNGFVDFSGTLYGQMLVNGFLMYGSTTTYENHIYNGVIDIGGLPDDFVHAGVVSNNKSQKIIKWLQ